MFYINIWGADHDSGIKNRNFVAVARYDAHNVLMTHCCNLLISLFQMYDTCFIVISGVLITILALKNRNFVAVARYDAHNVLMTHSVAIC